MLACRAALSLKTNRWPPKRDSKRSTGPRLIAVSGTRRREFRSIVSVRFELAVETARLSVGFTSSAEQRLSTSLDERCSCFLVTLFRLPQNLPEVRSTAQLFQPRVLRERDRGGISAVDGVCQKLHGPISSAEMGQLSRKVVKAFRVA
jgi:hypothetical protein